MPPRDLTAAPTLDPIEDIARRRLLGALPLLGLLAAGINCNDDTPAETPSTEWQFTDDRGVTITLPKRPERIVASSALAPALWDFGIRPVGAFGYAGEWIGSMDLDAVAELGAWDAFDMEKLAELEPDLIITGLYPHLDVAGASQEVVEQIAPIIAINYGESPLNKVIERVGVLAGAVGADLASAEITQAREAFDQASQALVSAITEKPDLTVMFMAAHPGDHLYIANPAWFPDLLYYQQLGLNIITPDAPDVENTYWEYLSWERATKYPADLVFQQVGAPSADELGEQPTWAMHPAAQAGQVTAATRFGEGGFVLSYQGVTPVLEAMTEIIRNSRDDVV